MKLRDSVTHVPTAFFTTQHRIKFNGGNGGLHMSWRFFQKKLHKKIQSHCISILNSTTNQTKMIHFTFCANDSIAKIFTRLYSAIKRLLEFFTHFWRIQIEFLRSLVLSESHPINLLKTRRMKIVRFCFNSIHFIYVIKHEWSYRFLY